MEEPPTLVTHSVCGAHQGPILGPWLLSMFVLPWVWTETSLWFYVMVMTKIIHNYRSEIIGIHPPSLSLCRLLAKGQVSHWCCLLNKQKWYSYSANAHQHTPDHCSLAVYLSPLPSFALPHLLSTSVSCCSSELCKKLMAGCERNDPCSCERACVSLCMTQTNQGTRLCNSKKSTGHLFGL